MLNPVFWKALVPIVVNAVAPVKLAVLSEFALVPKLSFLIECCCGKQGGNLQTNK